MQANLAAMSDGTGRCRTRTGPSRGRWQSRDDVAVAIPETDVPRIQLWCRERVPEHLWPQVKVEADIGPRHVTIVEVRPPWDGVGEHTRFPIARLRYTASTGLWSIYWRDRNLKFHQYDRKRPTKNVQALLDHIADSGDPIFWG